MNKVILKGNLSKDPELRYTPNGTAVTTFSVAVNRKYKQGDETKQEVCFIDVVAWSKLAEVCSLYIKKGSSVLIEGRLQQQTWEDKGGGKRSKHQIVLENIEFLDKFTQESEEVKDEEIPF